MKALTSKELENVVGGADCLVGVAIAAIVVFLSGVIDGITNPGRCNG